MSENHTPASTDLPVGDIVANQRWTQRADPFPHVVAADVFTAPFYRELEGAYRRLLNRGLTERPSTMRFARSHGAYDAHVFDLSRPAVGPLGIFTTRSFHAVMADIIGVASSGYVAGALHHHEPGGRDGSIRTGFSAPRAVDRHHADVLNDANPIVRAAAIIFFLNNLGWEPGAGGEMALYRHADDDVRAPVCAIPPRNNSLVAFACTPMSFHAVRANRYPLNSVIVSLHQDRAAAVERWGADRFERWRS